LTEGAQIDGGSVALWGKTNRSKGADTQENRDEIPIQESGILSVREACWTKLWVEKMFCYHDQDSVQLVMTNLQRPKTVQAAVPVAER
jgi:hypothetical protein